MEKLKCGLDFKYLVYKVDDVKKYLNEEQDNELSNIEMAISEGRLKDRKPIDNEYIVVNTDEPCAELVKKLILGEVSAKEIIETIARNCVAWDTSKDKKEGLLPEVAYFKNPSLYKRLTGEEYNYSKAVKKFHIGED